MLNKEEIQDGMNHGQWLSDLLIEAYRNSAIFVDLMRPTLRSGEIHIPDAYAARLRYKDHADVLWEIGVGHLDPDTGRPWRE